MQDLELMCKVTGNCTFFRHEFKKKTLKSLIRKRADSESGKRKVLFRSADGCQQVPALIRQKRLCVKDKNEKGRKRQWDTACVDVCEIVYVSMLKCVVIGHEGSAEGRMRPSSSHIFPLCQSIVINPDKGLLDNSNWPFPSFSPHHITAEYWKKCTDNQRKIQRKAR